MKIFLEEDIEESNTIRIALIGCGRAVERIYLPVINKFRYIKVVAAVDPIEKRRDLVCKNFKGCISYSSMNENLINQVDAGIITSPPDAHISLASEFVKKNKYVLVEKPLALSMDGINKLKEIESSSKASLMMGFNYRYWLPITKLKEKLSGNNEVDFAEIIFTSEYSKWNPVSFTSDPLDDLGPHVFDLIRYLFNREIISISANPSEAKGFKLKIKIAKDLYIHCCLAHCNQTIRTINISGKAGKFSVTFKSIRTYPESGLIRNFLDICTSILSSGKSRFTLGNLSMTSLTISSISDLWDILSPI